MTHHAIPHFHNNSGVAVVHVGAKEFMCMGAIPPFDHPHVFIDMGKENDAVCPYCSTHYKFDSSLTSTQSEPPECAWALNAA